MWRQDVDGRTYVNLLWSIAHTNPSTEGQWERAGIDFFQSFNNYSDAASPQRIQVLKYLVLANLLQGGEINPFDSTETKPWANCLEYNSCSHKSSFIDTRTILKSRQWPILSMHINGAKYIRRKRSYGVSIWVLLALMHSHRIDRQSGDHYGRPFHQISHWEPSSESTNFVPHRSYQALYKARIVVLSKSELYLYDLMKDRLALKQT